MAIAFDAVSSKIEVSSSSIITLAHTVGVGSNTLLVVQAATHGDAASPSSATYNGVSMTLADTRDNGSAVKMKQFYLVNPTVGTNNIVVTFSSAVVVGSVAGISVTGAAQTLPLGNVNGATGNSTAPSTALTTGNANSLIVSYVAWEISTGGNPSATGTNQTRRWFVDSGSPAGEAAGSTQTTTTAGSYTGSWSSGASSREYAHSLIEIKQVQESIAADVGTFALTGNDASFRVNRLLSADVGTFTLAGQAVNLLTQHLISLALGVFTLTGKAVGLITDLLWDNDAKPSDSVYTNETKPTTSYSSDTKPTSSWTNQNKP